MVPTVSRCYEEDTKLVLVISPQGQAIANKSHKKEATIGVTNSETDDGDEWRQRATTQAKSVKQEIITTDGSGDTATVTVTVPAGNNNNIKQEPVRGDAGDEAQDADMSNESSSPGKRQDSPTMVSTVSRCNEEDKLVVLVISPQGVKVANSKSQKTEATIGTSGETTDDDDELRQRATTQAKSVKQEIITTDGSGDTATVQPAGNNNNIKQERTVTAGKSVKQEIITTDGSGTAATATVTVVPAGNNNNIKQERTVTAGDCLEETPDSVSDSDLDIKCENHVIGLISGSEEDTDDSTALRFFENQPHRRLNNNNHCHNNDDDDDNDDDVDDNDDKHCVTRKKREKHIYRLNWNPDTDNDSGSGSDSGCLPRLRCQVYTKDGDELKVCQWQDANAILLRGNRILDLERSVLQRKLQITLQFTKPYTTRLYAIQQKLNAKKEEVSNRIKQQRVQVKLDKKKQNSERKNYSNSNSKSKTATKRRGTTSTRYMNKCIGTENYPRSPPGPGELEDEEASVAVAAMDDEAEVSPAVNNARSSKMNKKKNKKKNDDSDSAWSGADSDTDSTDTDNDDDDSVVVSECSSFGWSPDGGGSSCVEFSPPKYSSKGVAVENKGTGTTTTTSYDLMVHDDGHELDIGHLLDATMAMTPGDRTIVKKLNKRKLLDQAKLAPTQKKTKTSTTREQRGQEQQDTLTLPTRTTPENGQNKQPKSLISPKVVIQQNDANGTIAKGEYLELELEAEDYIHQHEHEHEHDSLLPAVYDLPPLDCLLDDGHHGHDNSDNDDDKYNHHNHQESSLLSSSDHGFDHTNMDLFDDVDLENIMPV
jgi:hypothetical protein